MSRGDAKRPDLGLNDEPTEWSDASESARRRHGEKTGDVPTRSIREPGDRHRPSDEPPVRDTRIGTTLVGRYRVEQLVGKGGMGRVYLATQLPLNRPVAVKILSPEFQKKDPQFPRRFFLEAATAAQLNHPNTITVFDYGETEEGELFIAMEFLKGRPLSRAISADGPFSAERTLHVSMQIVRALREAHQKGIIHRDLKPGNIMLLAEGDDVDYAKVLDFGLVKLFHTDTSNHQKLFEQLSNENDAEEVGELTRAGMFLGSPKYMSPEQIEGRPLDPRTDIYSLGVIMFQMLAGRVPFRGNASVEIIYKHVNQPVPAIHEVNPEADAPPELERLVARCLEKSQHLRPASMADLLLEMKDVRRLITGVSSVSGLSLDSIGQYAAASLPPAPSLPPATVTTPPKEAAFTDSVIPDDAPSVPLERRSNPVKANARPPVRWVPIVFAGLALLSVGIGAFVLSQPAPEPPVVAPPVPDPEPERVTTQIHFESRPDQADVFENEVRVGRTPLDLEVTTAPNDSPSHRFVFKKEGFHDELVEERLEGARLRIVATLKPVEPEVKPPPLVAPKRSPSVKKTVPPKSPPDYKENPY
ncbi:MAG: serine/threonine protein kinase [Deltaproteobacteria bacterium]|nr:serine/threonine protein kinase [Deltaproteobacteria bacterium]